MIKHLSLLVLFTAPSFAFGQAAPVRPNHTLPQYSTVIAANSNAGAPRSMLRAAPAAGSYTAFWPLGGIRRDTSIPSLYADGRAGTLAQIGLMADGSVQQADVGATVAPLDANQKMSAPVSGDIGSAPYFGGASLAALAEYRANLKERGVSLTPSTGPSDVATINSIFSTNNYGYNGGAMAIDIPYGVWPSSRFIPQGNGRTRTVIFSKNLLNWPGYIIDGNTIPYFGDGVVSIGNNSSNSDGFVVSRVDGNDTNYTQWQPVVQKNLVVDSSKFSAQDGFPPPEQNDTANLYLTSKHNGIASNRFDQIRTHASTGYGSQVVGDWQKFWIEDDGQNWAWNFIYEMIDPSSRNCAALITSTNTPCRRWNGELDWSGVGHEDPRSAYAPGYSIRQGLWFTSNHDAMGDQTWAANHAYVSHHILSVADPSGQLWMYDSGTGGTSGATQPTWPYDATKTVTDRGVTWTPLGKWAFDIGFVLGVGGPADTRIGTLFWLSGPKIYNAISDWSLAAFDTPVHVIERRPADSYTDYTGDGTSGGQNNHLLGYDSSQKALTYKVNGVPVLSIKDSGAVISSAPPQMPVMTRAQIRSYPSPAKGMEIYDSDDDAPAIYTGAGWKLMTLSALPAN
ncbi:MAG: hypothetical protein ABF443_00010 [Acetobacter malorum]|uniref:hypothetical protein n=1 Tax=Acetobacter malorum TaxID=178901 RepID=UPI0039E96CDB